MEAGDGSTVVNNPAVIKAAQEEIGRLNVLVCGQCHLVFHFIEEFQEHQNKEGACSKTSHFRDNGNNEQKAQVWAFLLWKDTQIQQETTDKDSVTSWKLYQKWCKMEQHVRETWITAGRTIQAFTKINNAKMTDMRSHNTDGAKQPIIVRKVVRNGQPEDSSEAKKKEIKSEVKAESSESAPTTTTTTTAQTKKVMQNRPKAFVKPRVRPGKTQPDDELNDEEFAVEKIMAKRYNTKKRCAEYYLKWEGYAPEFNTWESADVVSCCKFLLEEFERNLAKQKEMKELKAQQLAQQQQQQQQQTTKIINRTVTQKTIIKAEPSTPGPSSAAQITRPMRSSKSKAMDQVKQWCGSMKEEDNDILGKRRADLTDSDSDTTAAKRAKGEGASDEDYTGESEEERNTTGRSDVIQRAFNRANAQSNGSNKTVSSSDLATSLGLQSPDPTKTHQSPVLVANAKGVVKVDPKQMPNLASGVYVMSKKEGIIKLDSSPAGKQIKSGTGGVLMVPNRENPTVVRRQVITASQANSITPVKVVSKPDGSQVVTQMKVISKQVPAKPRQSLGPKNEPVKIQPKPDPTQLQQIHVVTAVQNPIGMQPRITTNVRPSIQQQQQQQKTADGRPLLPRPSVRGPGPTSVLGIGSIRSPVRAPTPRLQTPQTRAPMQKRVVAGSPQATMSPTQQTQLRAKYIASPNQIVKTVVSTAQLKQSPGNKLSPGNKQTQSLISPQQKTLMTKRKTQELTPQGVVKTPMKTMVNTKAPAGRGRGKITTTTPVATPGKPKETKIVESGGLHMEFQEVGSEESSDEAGPDISSEADNLCNIPQNPPESPERPFTLCPLTGRIIGEDGEPVAEAEPTPSHTSVDTTAASSITGTTVTATTSAGESMDTSSSTTTTTTELVLPSLESLTETNSIMRVEMSPGGTTGTIVQASTDPTAQLSLAGVTIAPDLPCLDDTATTSVTSVQSTVSLTETIASDAIATTTGLTGTIVTSSASNVTNVKQEIKDEERKVVADDASNVVTITGEDGVVYQVAGHAEDGQTLLVTRGADGEQQCVYVTTEQQGDEGSVLTLDHAVAEAVAQLMPDQVNLAPQFYVKEGEGEATENQMVMSIMDNSAAGAVGSQEDPEGQAQVVAQVVQADEPTPGGTRRVVLLLPDGNLMMTEVDEEQYAALELDK